MTHRIPALTRRAALAAAAVIGLLGASGAAEARDLEAAKAAGTVVIGIQGDNSPWGFIDATGKQDGFDAEIGTAFAKWLGVDVSFVPLAVANRIPALQTGKVDVLFATMGMTAERAKTTQYSIPYASNQLSIVAAKDMAAAGPEDLAGKAVGVPRASALDTNFTAMAPSSVTLRRFDDDAVNIQALLSGQVNAVGANQFYLQRLEIAAPGRFENKFGIGALYNGAGSRMGEADWNTALNSFLA